MFDKIKNDLQTAIKKQPQSARLLSAGAAVLVIGGSLATYWLIVQNNQIGNTPIGSEVIPQNAAFAVSLTADSNQWQKFKQFGTPESRALIDEQIKQWRNQLLTEKGYDYEKDIQPWVGREVMLAWLTPQTSGIVNQPLLMVLPVSNGGRAKQWFNNPSKASTERTYKEIKIKENLTKENSFSVALLDEKYGLISNDPKALDQAIDSYKNGQSITKIPGYSQAFGQLEKSGSVARVFVNFPAATQLAAMNSVRAIAPENLEKLQLQGIASNLTLEPEGLRFQGISWLKPDSEKKQIVENNAKSISSKVPANTLMMISGTNLQHLWKDYAENADANPLAPMSPQWLKNGIASSTGLNLEKDLLSWMSGEFSLSLIPDAAKTNPQFPTSLVLMVRSNDRRAGEEALKKLNKVMTDKYRYKVEETKVNDQFVTNWTSQYGGITLSHGWLNGNVAFLTLGARVTPTFNPRPQTPLPASETFQKAMKSKLENPGGQLFVNLEEIMGNKQLFFLQLPPVFQTITGAIRTIGFTSVVANDRNTKFDILLQMKQQTQPVVSPTPTNKPQPSPSPQKK
ncbi:MAG TPA: DUF3352 domain-containing protein [Halomicronema sp.]